MFIDIKEISKEGKLFSGKLSLEPIDWQHGETIAVSEVGYDLKLTREERGLSLQGEIKTTLTLKCSRCLESCSFPLKRSFFLTLQEIREVKGKGEYQLEEEEVDLFPLKEGKADLKEILVEQIYLSLPLKPLCSESCKGLCLKCGENLNLNRCRCALRS